MKPPTNHQTQAKFHQGTEHMNNLGRDTKKLVVLILTKQRAPGIPTQVPTLPALSRRIGRRG